MAQLAKLLPVMSASLNEMQAQVLVALLPIQLPGKAERDGSITQPPASHMGDLDGVTGS